MTRQHAVNGSWTNEGTSEVYRAEATDPAGNVIGRVSIHVDIDVGHQYQMQVGDAVKGEIEKAAKDILDNIVK